MSNFLSKLTEVGTTYIDDSDILMRVKTANFSIIISFFAYLLGGGIASYYIPQLTVVVTFDVLCIILSYVIIFTGYHLAGRLLFINAFFLSILIIHIILVKENELPLAILGIIITAFWILPWNIFSYAKERAPLLTSAVFGVAAVVLLPFSNDWIEIPDINNSILQEPYFFLLLIFLSAIINMASMLIFVRLNESDKRKAEKLLKELSRQKASAEQTNQELLASLAELKTLQASEEIRKKSILHQAELSDVLRAYSQDLEKACDRAISLITRYIDANAGALFLHEEAGNHSYLEMIACYANGKRKYISKKFSTSEGLVGQVFMEKAHIIANNIPEEHIQIASGLGELAPTHLLIVPMLQNDIVIGVMEFASFRPFDALIVEMAERLANITASIIITTRINQRTQELLEQSQHQTEDLRAREEEMRQNMEELAATQEEMARINDELSNKSIAVNILLGVVEIGIDKRILSANDNFAEIIGYTKEELLEMTHADLVPFDVYEKQEYDMWWDSLIEGRFFNGKSIRKTKSGKKITLNCCYRPVFSPTNREIIKIIKYCYPVTMQF
ncbi:GAF domain-containing protein [Rhodoflexus caldus]|uniref:GAF domain-containing protein n=1 Tax=Rhodoflexus caldus TaxID=2891236 RepID=UPI00202A5C71|nr:GAF domain-containing protein [Rhodoflexus caldus]